MNTNTQNLNGGILRLLAAHGYAIGVSNGETATIEKMRLQI